MSISVALATYNGEKYIAAQLISILNQLTPDDELIVSDNYSTDKTVEVINSLNDKRIKIIYRKRESNNSRVNCYYNFENALKETTGDIIFLADQDDLWSDNKVAVCLKALEVYDVVVSDCKVISENGEIILESFFKRRKSGVGFLKNFIANGYIGSCLVFKRKILSVALPFPEKMPMHDILLGTIAELFFKTAFLPEQLVFYREHTNNVSYTASGISEFSVFKKIEFRLEVIWCIPILLYRKYLKTILLTHRGQELID